MIFRDCLLECCQNKDLIASFNRLTGRHFKLNDDRAPIEKMIDEATGYQETLKAEALDDTRAFVCFVFEIIWVPLVKQGFKEQNKTEGGG